MKKSRFTDSQIMAILKQAEAGTPVPELCREHGMSSASFYKWRAKYGGMDTSMMARLKELEAENRRLKKMYAEERLKAEIAREAIEKSGSAISTQRDGAALNPAVRYQHPHGLRNIRHQPERVLLPCQACRRKRCDRRLVDSIDHGPAKLGLRAMFLVFAQYQRLQMESQARLPHLPRAGTESAYQTAQAPTTATPRAFRNSHRHQSDLVHGFHARPTGRWPQHPPAQCRRRF